VHVLDRYLGARFEPIARFGFYEVLVQRGSTP
jgi:hypothetical protein